MSKFTIVRTTMNSGDTGILRIDKVPPGWTIHLVDTRGTIRARATFLNGSTLNLTVSSLNFPLVNWKINILNRLGTTKVSREFSTINAGDIFEFTTTGAWDTPATRPGKVILFSSGSVQDVTNEQLRRIIYEDTMADYEIRGDY